MEQKVAYTSEPEKDEEEFSWSEMMRDSRSVISRVLRNKLLLVTATVVGASLGVGYALWKPATYVSKISFVVEDTKSTGGGLMSALSGLGGLDISGMLGGSGMLSGDNITAILKSRVLMKEALLTPYQTAGNYSLADRYAEVYGWKEKWKSSKKVNRLISFPAGKINLSRQEDSLFQKILKRIEEKELNVYKPDKKLTVFNLEVNTRDEQLSRLFSERLLKITGDFYIETKTGRLKENVNRLQKRADSIGILLNRKTYASSDAERMLLNANPIYTSPNVSAEISGREKVMVGTIYAEIVKNLEISKTALIQQTPTVQIVDESELPLKKNETEWWEGLMTGAAAGFACMFIGLFFFRRTNA